MEADRSAVAGRCVEEGRFAEADHSAVAGCFSAVQIAAYPLAVTLVTLAVVKAAQSSAILSLVQISAEKVGSTGVQNAAPNGAVAANVVVQSVGVVLSEAILFRSPHDRVHVYQLLQASSAALHVHVHLVEVLAD